MSTGTPAELSIFHSIGQIFHPIFVFFGWLLAGIYAFIPNYAVAIAILTVLIMAALTPLTVKSTKSMLAMQRLQPEVKKLQQKYKGPENRQQLNEELMKLYRESGTSPTGACLPMFLQMPFLFILYNVIKGLTATTTATIGGMQITFVTPKYIPPDSKMHQDLVASGGQMVSFGVNLALKPLSHHGSPAAYIPYFVLVVAAVLLQYFQMKQMNSRNPQASQANPQMQNIQKIMPLLFAYIYFIVPAAVTIYMIVSSAIRIGTQEVMFRTGVVEPVGVERKIGGAGSGKEGGAKGKELAPAKSGSEKSGSETSSNGAGASSSGNGNGTGAGVATVAAAAAAAGAAKKRSGSRTSGSSGRNGSGGNGAEEKPKTSPQNRSKSKRSRKAR